jgi:hypothetical protein
MLYLAAYGTAPQAMSMEFVVPKVPLDVVRTGEAKVPFAITSASAIDPTPPTESVISIETLKVPATLEVPDITPVLVFKVRPFGRVPARTDQLE